MKKVIAIVMILTLLAVLAGCHKVERALDKAEDRIENALDPEEKAPKTQAAISKEQAENIALEHAGLTREQAQSIRAEYDYDDGRAEYDVTIYAGELEYEFEIHAESGQILSYDTEPIRD